VTKCLSASRAKTKEKGFEIILMYIEIERHENVQVGIKQGSPDTFSES
jgi:predicted ABC-type ATPase